MRGGGYIPQELATNILLRLTDGSAIARFRCVNKQWRRLLSDSKFINRVLWFDQHEDDEKKESTTNVLIQHHHEDRRVYRDRLFYSLHTYDQKDERLTPSQTTTENHEGLQFQNVQLVPGVVRPSSESRFSIVGCCGGIFCVSYVVTSRRMEIILWNPSTSETKILPVSSNIPVDNRMITDEQIGFGFDSKTNDHKVVKKGMYHQYSYNMILTEVYSLRNDSWRVSDRVDFAPDDFSIYGHKPPTRHVAQSHNSGRRRVYWHSNEAIESFDMIDEVFDTGHKFPRKLKRSTTKKGDECVTDQMRMQTTQKEFMMLAIFGSSRRVYEIWGLLDYRKPQSWTKLFAISRFKVSDVRIGLGPLGTHGRCFLFFKKLNKLMTIDPETEEIKNIPNHRAIDTPEWHFSDFDVVTYSYVPSQISISNLNSVVHNSKELI